MQRLALTSDTSPRATNVQRSRRLKLAPQRLPGRLREGGGVEGCALPVRSLVPPVDAACGARWARRRPLHSHASELVLRLLDAPLQLAVVRHCNPAAFVSRISFPALLRGPLSATTMKRRAPSCDIADLGRECLRNVVGFLALEDSARLMAASLEMRAVAGAALHWQHVALRGAAAATPRAVAVCVGRTDAKHPLRELTGKTAGAHDRACDAS